MEQNGTLIKKIGPALAIRSPSHDRPRPPGATLLDRVPWPRLRVAMFQPCTSLHMPNQSGGHGTRSTRVQLLGDSLTDLLTDLLTDWMITLTICAKVSRARGNLRRANVLRGEPTPAAPSARQESQLPSHL